MQINLQNKKTATSNIFQIVDQLNIDIVLIHEPHIIDNKLIGIPKNTEHFRQHREEPVQQLLQTRL